MVEMEMDVKSKRKMNLGENREKRRKEPDERLRESMVPCHCRRCYGKEERSPSFQKKVL
jgi:hypothetical protein